MKMFLSRDVSWQTADCDPKEITLFPYLSSETFVNVILAMGVLNRYSEGLSAGRLQVDLRQK
jgi:hypothetical protein